MQTNLNSSPNFGMALKFSESGQKALTRRIRNASDIEVLEKLKKEQLNNPINVDIREGSNRLEAFLTDSLKNKTVICTPQENWIERNFKSPIAFIKRVCKLADNINEKEYNPKFSDKLKTIFDDSTVE